MNYDFLTKMVHVWSHFTLSQYKLKSMASVYISPLIDNGSVVTFPLQ
jgi:hypothetical protein